LCNECKRTKDERAKQKEKEKAKAKEKEKEKESENIRKNKSKETRKEISGKAHLSIFSNPSSLNLLNLSHDVELFVVESRRFVNEAVRVAEGQNFCAFAHQFLGTILGHVTRTGNEAALTLES